jgi:O-antigen ligase
VGFGGRPLTDRHPQLALVGAGVLGALVLMPGITRPTMAILLGVAVVGVWLATKSVAYPLALAFIPSLLEGVYGSNPLPKGGTTLLFGAWIALAIVIASARGQRPRTLASAPVILTFVLLALMVVRLGPSPSVSYGSMKLQLFVANNVLLMLGAVFVGARVVDTKRFFGLMLGILAAEAFLLVFELASGSAQQVVADRFTISAQQYPIELGRSSADGMLLAIYTMLAAGTIRGRLCAAAVFPAMAVTLIASGSRGPVLGFLFAVLVLLALAAASPRARGRLIKVAATALGAIVAVPLLVPGSSASRALSAIFGGTGGLSTNGRAGLWATAVSAFSHHPLLGIGTGGFAGLRTGEFYPHNLLLESAAELGALGAIVVIWLVVGSLRRMARAWRARAGRERLELSVAIALFVGALINALVSGAIQDNREVWLWAGLGLGICARRVAVARAAPPEPEQPEFSPGPTPAPNSGPPMHRPPRASRPPLQRPAEIG